MNQPVTVWVRTATGHGASRKKNNTCHVFICPRPRIALVRGANIYFADHGTKDPASDRIRTNIRTVIDLGPTSRPKSLPP